MWKNKKHLNHDKKHLCLLKHLIAGSDRGLALGLSLGASGIPVAILLADHGAVSLALPCLADSVVKLVDLLEGKILGLVDEGPDESDGDPAETTPDPEDVGAEVGVLNLSEVRGDESEEPVEEPVGGGGHRKTLGADLEREDLASDDPSCGTEGGGEEEDVDADEGELGAGGGVVGGRCCDTSGCDNVLRDTHTESTGKEDGTTTEAVNGPETREGGDDVDNVGDDGEDEGTGQPLDGRVGRSVSAEVGGTVVEDEVDTNKLLERLEGNTGESTLASVALEALEVGSSSERHLILVVGGDLSKLGGESGVVLGKAAEEVERLSGLFLLVLLDQETRGFGEEEHSNAENERPGELDGERDTVRATVAAVLGGWRMSVLVVRDEE